MQLNNEEAERLVKEGVAALNQGRPAEAAARFERVTRAGRANAQIWLLLATARRAADDPAGEEAALDALLAMEPRIVRGHVMKGDCRARAGDDCAAINFYKSAMLLARDQQLPEALAAELRRAEAAAAELEARLDLEKEKALAARGVAPGTRSPRFQESLDIMAGRKRIFVQEPSAYYFPGLPQIQYYEREAFDWVPTVEAAAPAIRDELQALLATGTDGFRPYLQADPNRPRLDDNQLLDSRDWSALFLCENGEQSDDVIARCPRAWEAVQAAPLPRIAHSPTIMFSLLRAGARIAPHSGVHNVRLTCHLPLVVPPGCAFRVGNEVRAWEEGKLLIFDDTIEHEAWNDSNEDRIVLIFDIWRPEISAQERREIGALFAGPALN
jgi:hypothetical protein